MGSSFSLDPNEYRAAAQSIEGYGSLQMDHGSALAAGTSTPLSSSGTGIAGAISQIAQGTVQKIVTDVTSTTAGFAGDTAKGLRAQAASADQLETDLAGHAKSILNGTQSSLLGGGYATGGMSTATGSALTGFAASAPSTSTGAPMTTGAPFGEGSGAEGETAATESGAFGQEQAQSHEATAMPMEGMMGARGGTAAGATEERGQRPGYLKSKTELAKNDGDRTKAVIAQHLQECGMAPIPLDPGRLVCAKCGSILPVEESLQPSTSAS